METTSSAAGDEGAVIDRFYAALTAGDIEAARACCAAEALFWHCFDGVAQDLATASQGWAALKGAFAELAAADVRRARTDAGSYVQRHLFMGRKPSGELVGWPVCLMVEVRNGLIWRIDEYIDRAGALAFSSTEAATPGLAPLA